MTGPVDEPVTQHGPRRIADEIGRCHKTGDHRLDLRGGEADAHQRADASVGELDQANAQDQRSHGGEDGARSSSP
jgi:hypothetical protein